MAYKVAYGKKINKNDFGGGMETVRFFERLGFESNIEVVDGKAKRTRTHSSAKDIERMGN